MTGLYVEDCAGSVSLGFLPAYRSCETLVMVRLQLESGKQFRDGSASWVLFVHDRSAWPRWPHLKHGNWLQKSSHEQFIGL